jgi:hypothetical protein
MKSIESVGVDFGLIHTGLNPEGPEVDHLFNKSQVEALLNDLENLQTTQTEDLEPLKDWIASDYQQGDRINLGILFCKDSEDKIRVCLHAKIARSKFEVSLSADKHIREVHLIQAIKLIDSSRREIPVRLAPLICSDFIFAPGEISLDLPVHAISKGPPPTNQVEWVDHIDLISVINCSPTGPKGKPLKGLLVVILGHEYARVVFCLQIMQIFQWIMREQSRLAYQVFSSLWIRLKVIT